MLGKRARTATPPLSERVMLFVRQDSEDVYTALHVVPPTTQGLLHAVSTRPDRACDMSRACRLTYRGPRLVATVTLVNSTNCGMRGNELTLVAYSVSRCVDLCNV